jgi:hypothetical protein
VIKTSNPNRQDRKKDNVMRINHLLAAAVIATATFAAATAAAVTSWRGFLAGPLDITFEPEDSL